MNQDTRRMQKTPYLKAIILDSDGVIADPRDQHNYAIQTTLKEFNFDEFAKRDYRTDLMSSSARKIFSRLIESDGLKHPKHASPDELAEKMYARKTEIYIETIKKDISARVLKARRGIDDLLLQADEHMVPLGVASASNAAAVGTLINMLGFDGFLGHNIICHGAHYKPDPRSYLQAMLGCRIYEPRDFKRCVAIEDTAVGAESALVAGMRVVITLSSFSNLDDLEALEKDGVSPDDLRRLRTGKMPDEHIKTLALAEQGKPQRISIILHHLVDHSEEHTIIRLLDDICA